MKTTVDTPEELLHEAIEHSGAETKREAVVIAINDFNRLERLAAELGTFEDVMSVEELVRLRASP